MNIMTFIDQYGLVTGVGLGTLLAATAIVRNIRSGSGTQGSRGRR
ncbi:hypothetical protein [Flexivirga caeni]|nr:hypothetical protein [Flexivirga caeni]